MAAGCHDDNANPVFRPRTRRHSPIIGDNRQSAKRVTVQSDLSAKAIAAVLDDNGLVVAVIGIGWRRQQVRESACAVILAIVQVRACGIVVLHIFTSRQFVESLDKALCNGLKFVTCQFADCLAYQSNGESLAALPNVLTGAHTIT